MLRDNKCNDISKKKKSIVSDPDAHESKETRGILAIQVYKYCTHMFAWVSAHLVYIQDTLRTTPLAEAIPGV